MVRNFARAVGLVGLLVAVACGGPGDGGDSERGDSLAAASRPGLGRSTQAPTGTPYVLPGGIEIVQPIQGYGSHCIPAEQRSQEAKGSGALVRLCLILRNTTSQPGHVELPPGLIFISDELTTQNGLLVQDVSIQIPAQQQLHVPLHLYCLNESRAPSAPWDTFTLGPVTQEPGLRELIDLVKEKLLPVPGLTEVQAAVSNVTDGHGLTAQDRDSLGRLSARGTGPGTGLTQ